MDTEGRPAPDAAAEDTGPASADARARADEPPADSVAVRKSLVEALRLDLVGPTPGHRFADERLPERERPSKWYLTGFLVPTDDRRVDLGEDEEVGETPAGEGDSEDSAAKEKAAKKTFFPSSIGLSFRAPGDLETLELVARWGDYELVDGDRDDGKKARCWRRGEKETAVSVSLSAGNADLEVPDSDGLQFHVRSRPASADGGAPDANGGERSVSVFLANRRERAKDEKERDLRFAFQAQLEVRADTPFAPMHDLRGADADDPDERVADLHYADAPEFAVGHGVSAAWDTEEGGGGCRRVRTEWIGSAAVERVETEDATGAERSMDALGALRDGPAAVAALEPLASGYRAWIEEQRALVDSLPRTRRETAERLLHEAGVAAARIERGIEALADDPALLDAFRAANRAVAAALRAPGAEGTADDSPRWRSFQLAFLLLNLPALNDRKHADRDLVDLLFFPTGGGKTEAYLALAAVAMVLRRLRRPEEEGRAGAGVSVIMRYTLRLLTIDQLNRASRLVCALELEREKARERYGSWPFEIGLWVGKAATPNQMGRKGDRRDDTARAKVVEFQRDGRTLPIPLASCPWCGKSFEPASFQLEPDADRPRDLRLRCLDFECEFGGGRPLPVLGVDEPLYRRLPAFLIATVDKFAALPWTGDSGLLLGGATHWDAQGFSGPGSASRGGRRLPSPLPPPDLVIQDEVHLISGPLGTMVGLYETAIGGLCSLRGSGVNPKIIASTATSRGANEQMQAVFARPRTALFPPPGITRRDSFFARARTPEESPARRYLGLAAPGRSPRVLMRRVVLALMGAAQRAFGDAGWSRNENNPADPYMTVLGYFNNLRVLGGARRILEEEVRSTLRSLGIRRRLGEKPGLFRDRDIRSEIVELTSRVSTGEVARARERLGRGFHEKGPVDWALATNMISVGMDIQRLGLMVVLGQPKVHAEYIQATSRVGRDANRPGLVVTLLSIDKPRDRSHYERFRHYHETFYRSVEAATVTPFSSRALDRGFAGAMVALARHAEPVLTPAEGARRISDAPADLRERVASVFRERIRRQPLSDEERDAAEATAQARTADLFDAWGRVRDGYEKDRSPLRYQPREGSSGPPLLREVLDRDFQTEHHRKFRAARSLRDVEPEVRISVRDPVYREPKR